MEIVFLKPSPLFPFTRLSNKAARTFIAMMFAGAIVLQFSVHGLAAQVMSPLHMLLVFLVVIGAVNALRNALLSKEAFLPVNFWTVSVLAFVLFALAEAVDIGVDENLRLFAQDSNDLPGLIFISVAAFVGGIAPQVGRGRLAPTLMLLSLSGFGAAFALREVLPTSWATGVGLSRAHVELFLQLLGLVFLLVFAVASLRPAQAGQRAWIGTAELENVSRQQGAFVGTRCRQMFFSGAVGLSPRHPPVALAFKPGFHEAAFSVTLIVMLIWAARPVKAGTGRGYLAQAKDMIRLWQEHRIDPLTYYASDLYKPKNMAWAPHLLTRFETKNGLFSKLNRHRKNPSPGHELNDKQLFAETCLNHGIAHPHPLALVDERGITPFAELKDMERDLFCKPRKSMGAKDTLTFRWCGSGRYEDAKGKSLDIFGVCAAAALKGKPMLIQPWLKNHSELEGFAKDSLLAFRLVTVLNEADEPEVTLAMLRLLSVLEPDWQHLPDEEYAAPIDLVTGELGLFTGENFKTALIRMETHPVTGIRVKGRILASWPAIQDIAITAHKACKHRVAVGWDIALTPEGPMVLEGNTNFCVMSLQRVHDCPAGFTRFGALMNYQVSQLY